MLEEQIFVLTFMFVANLGRKIVWRLVYTFFNVYLLCMCVCAYMYVDACIEVRGQPEGVRSLL